MSKEEIIKLADWLKNMREQLAFAHGDPLIESHLNFLKKAEEWLRSHND